MGNCFSSEANGGIVTKLAHSGPQVGQHPVVTFDLDLEHTLDADRPGDYCVQVW